MFYTIGNPMSETTHTYHVEMEDSEQAKEILRTTKEFFSDLNQLIQQDESIPPSLPLVVAGQLSGLFLKVYDDVFKYMNANKGTGFVSGREIAMVVNKSLRWYVKQVDKKLKDHAHASLN